MNLFSESSDMMSAYYFVAGKTMKLRHFTLDASCGGRRELQPIDQNLNYDSDYQVGYIIK